MTPVRRIFFRLEWSKSSKKRKGTMVKQPKPSTSQGTLGSISEQSHPDAMMTSPPRTPERIHPFRTQRGTFTSSGDRVYPPMLTRIATTSTTATPLRRPARLAIQQEDPSFDAVVVTTLPNYPFCCHEDLLSMSREGLFSVARMLNGRLPMTSQIPVGEWVPETVVRERIEVLVGIRPPVPMAPKAVKCAQTLSVAMDVDVEDGDGAEDSREGILPSPPSSPLALREKRRGSTRLAVLPSRVPRRRAYVQGSNGLNEDQAMNVIEDICISPRRFLEPLDEESEPSSEGGATARRYEDSDTDASIASSDLLDEHSAKRRKVSDDGRYARVFSRRASFGPRSPSALGSPSRSPLQQHQSHQPPLQFKFSVRRKPVMQALDELGVKAAPSPSIMVSASDSIDMLFNGGLMSPPASHLAN
ncbi:hypothetical protein FA13DRAFT_1710036 [Coprinellus micaceus]|uniref:Uncharacterized protein n=1 Tax=Coprinellus micaceus TaxID=71717 RepID=A0A4Y7T983_COPMI|nr:hypothetical protein FA13DRAFT_1710036 [Coprinellus micaceus]